MESFALVVVLGLGFVMPAQTNLDTSFRIRNNGVLDSVAAVQLVQLSLAVIDAPKRIDTDQETVDFTGRAMAPGDMTLSVNGMPVTLASDGTFRIRRQVPVGRSKLVLVVEGSYGDRAEHKIFVRRTAAQAAVTEYGNFHALVIGNNSYRHLSDLKMAVSDAEAVAAMLTEVYGFNVETLIDATRYDIISALSRKRAQLTEKDNLLIYYAGHGSLDVGSDEGYWLPVDAEPDNPVNWISNNNISGQLRAMSAKHVMVVADSCYSGKLTRKVEANLKTGAERSAWLERMNGRRSRTALTSGGLEPVLDAGGGGYSVFAKAFIERLRNNTQVLDGQGLFDAIKRPIVVNADQTPEYADIRKAGHDGGDFLFVPTAPMLSAALAAETPSFAPSVEATAASTETNAAIDLAYWQSIHNSNDPVMFDAYLQQFPNGSFTVLARLKRGALRAAAPTAAPETQTAAVVPPAEPGFGVEEMDAAFVALRTANVRAEPTTQAARIGRLAPDDAVIVTGKVTDRGWYRIDLKGEPAFVFGSLIARIDPGEMAVWTSIANSTDPLDFDAFLGEFPDGHFAARARAMQSDMASLAPEPAPTPAPAFAPAKTDLDIAFWESVKGSTWPADFEAYLRRFPDGHFADLAQNRLKAIRDAELREAVRLEAERQAAAGAEAARLAAEALRKEAKRQAELKAEAERQAEAAELETAMVTPPAAKTFIIDKEKVENDEGLRKAVTDYYEKAYIQKKDGYGGGDPQSFIDSFDKIDVIHVSGNVITAKVVFWWRLGAGSNKSGITNGTVTVETDGRSYKVLKFLIGGRTY